MTPDDRSTREALRRLDPAEVIAHAVERDPLAAARALHAALPIVADGCCEEACELDYCPRLCLFNPGAGRICADCCDDHACSDSEPL